MFRRANICPLQRALRDCVGGECVRKKRAAVEALRAVRPLPPLLAPGTRASGHGRRCAVRLAVCGQAEQGVWLAQAAARLGLVRPLFSSLPGVFTAKGSLPGVFTAKGSLPGVFTATMRLA